MFLFHSAAYLALGLAPMVHFPGHGVVESSVHFALAGAIILEHRLRRRRSGAPERSGPRHAANDN